MAMTRKEKEYVLTLEHELRISRALRFTSKIEPDVKIPSSLEGISKGYLFNSYIENPRVERSCSSCVSHSFGNDDKTSSQGARMLYSSKILALKALRHELEIKCAEKLAMVDKWIEDEDSKQGTP